jgi:uncharacterized protein
MNKVRGLSSVEMQELCPSGTFLLGYRGSIAHNMYIPSDDPDSIDDKDIMGVCVNPLVDYFGLAQTLGNRGVKEKFIGEWDAVTYELRKYVSLLAKSNPNVLSLLWLRPEHYIIKEPMGEALIAKRDMFVSRKIYHSFTGYAYGQLHRMTHQAFEGYMGTKRKALVEKFGYDTKNAAHCIRILRMGIEFLAEGELHVWREDAKQLLEIKRGEWSLEQVKAEADHLLRRAEAAYDRCRLPAEPNALAVDTFLVGLLREYFRLNFYQPGGSQNER